MTTTPTITPEPGTFHSRDWKWACAVLVTIVAILLLGIGAESYYLYRAFRHDAIAPVPSGLPTLPHPGAPTFQAATSAPGDWPPGSFAADDPWAQMSRLHQQMDQLFNETMGQFPAMNPAALPAMNLPNLDIREEGDHYTVRADMPGADKSTIKVNVEGRLLTISGERTSVNETKDRDKVIRSERSMAQFVRTVELPGPVQADAVDAKYDNGVLTLDLPKATHDASGTEVPVH